MNADNNRLDLTEEQVRAHGASAIQAMVDYYGSLADRRIVPDTTSKPVRSALQESLPELGVECDELLRIVQDDVLEFSHHDGHPRFFGYVASPGNAVAAIADMLVSMRNANVTHGVPRPLQRNLSTL